VSISVSKRSYSTAIKFYYVESSQFKQDASKYLKLGTSFKYINGKPVTKSLNLDGVQTCALRVIYALWVIGEKFGSLRCSRFVGTYDDELVILPSVAAEYKAILKGEILLKDAKSATTTTVAIKKELKNKRGIVLFSGGMSGATGHVTFCNDGVCVDGGD